MLILMFLLGTSYREKQKKYHILAKALTSLSFILLAIISLYCSKDTSYFFSLLPGLLLCFCGDVFLAIRSRTKKFKWFIGGIVMFAFAHLFFVYSLQKNLPFIFWHYLIPVFIMIIIYFIFKLPSIEAGKGKWPSVIYSYLVTLFVIKAIESMISWDYSMRGIFLLVGAICFVASDFMLIFLYFSEKKINWLHGTNLITYYIGVGFIASSIYFG